ncbi:MAG: hypothetical protein ACLGIT_14605 [Gammaproteobacteria bacterium]
MSTASIGRRLQTVLWPAFLMAGVLEMLVFAVVDPGSLHGFGGASLDWPPLAVYSVAFLVFWAVIAAAGFISQLLACSARDINEGRLSPDGP